MLVLLAEDIQILSLPGTRITRNGKTRIALAINCMTPEAALCACRRALHIPRGSSPRRLCGPTAARRIVELLRDIRAVFSLGKQSHFLGISVLSH